MEERNDESVDGKLIGKEGTPITLLRKPARVSLSPDASLFGFIGNKSVHAVNPTNTNLESINQDRSATITNGGSKLSFAATVQKESRKKIVKISEMRNDKSVEGAAVTIPLAAVEEVSARFANTLYGYFIGKRLAFRLVENYVKNTWAKYGLKRVQLHDDFFLFQFETKDGMDKVLENGPWIIRNIPLTLNIWCPNTDLKKAEVRKAPVWIKLHHIPIVAYSDIGLSLITTQIGKPVMLDSYTSNMCVSSWGKCTYARVLVELSADKELLDSLVIAIPAGKDGGHTLATIDIEYEWKPPRCSSCFIFDHNSDKCPKIPKVAPTVIDAMAVDEGFVEVKKKKNKNKSRQIQQIDGIRLTKPPLKMYYRRVDKGLTITPSDSQPKRDSQQPKVTTRNSFELLDEEGIGEESQSEFRKHEDDIINMSDSEVDEDLLMDELGTDCNSADADAFPGASTPVNNVSND